MQPPGYIPLNHWHHYRRIPFLGLSRTQRNWLLDRGSLTQRLIRASDGHFRVRKIVQNWQYPTRSEIKRLGIKRRELTLVREVVLECRNEPWVYARSLFPLSTLTGHLRWLKTLDNRSLGAVLFQDPGMRRTLFEIAALDSDDVLPAGLNIDPTVLWGRRSLFFLDRKPILVAEIFLPAMSRHAL